MSKSCLNTFFWKRWIRSRTLSPSEAFWLWLYRCTE